MAKKKYTVYFMSTTRIFKGIEAASEDAAVKKVLAEYLPDVWKQHSILPWHIEAQRQED